MTWWSSSFLPIGYPLNPANIQIKARYLGQSSICYYSQMPEVQTLQGKKVYLELLRLNTSNQVASPFGLASGKGLFTMWKHGQEARRERGEPEHGRHSPFNPRPMRTTPISPMGDVQSDLTSPPRLHFQKFPHLMLCHSGDQVSSVWALGEYMPTIPRP